MERRKGLGELEKQALVEEAMKQFHALNVSIQVFCCLFELHFEFANQLTGCCLATN